MQNLKAKLSSRKLWAAILAAVASIVVAFFGEQITPEVISALECVVTAAVAYIFGEGVVDVARVIAEAISKLKLPPVIDPDSEDQPTEDDQVE